MGGSKVLKWWGHKIGARKILLINIHYSLKLLNFIALNRVVRDTLVPSLALYAPKGKFLQCEATSTVVSALQV